MEPFSAKKIIRPFSPFVFVLLSSLLLISLFFSLSSFAETYSSTKLYHGKVIKISDGDTVQFLAVGEPLRFKVRMIATDTAEAHLGVPGRGEVNQGHWADQGTAELTSMIRMDQDAILEVFGEDSYGRKLGRILQNGKDINLEMVRSGWASLYMICEIGQKCYGGGFGDKDLQDYRNACEEAVSQGRGLFNPSQPVPELPFVFRSRMQRRKLSKTVGDLNTREYVNPKDYEKVSICNRIFYWTEQDAIQNGFKKSH